MQVGVGTVTCAEIVRVKCNSKLLCVSRAVQLYCWAVVCQQSCADVLLDCCVSAELCSCTVGLLCVSRVVQLYCCTVVCQQSCAAVLLDCCTGREMPAAPLTGLLTGRCRPLR
jgi:hypothetical protein